MKNRNLRYRVSVVVLSFYGAIAVLQPFLAGNLPIICIEDSKYTFPFMNASSDRKDQIESKKCIMPLIPYSGKYTIDKNNFGLSPLEQNRQNNDKSIHWLGTDKIGRDVAAGMINGCRIALKIGFLSVLFSFLIGVSLGMMAGYYQDSDLHFPLTGILIFIALVPVGLYMLWMEFFIFRADFILFFLIGSLFIIILSGILYILRRILPGKTIQIPLDTILVKLIEIRKSFPGVFLLLALVSIFTIPSVWNVVFIITLMSWADFARLARGDTLSLKNENFILSSKILGIPDSRIILKHILPNIMPTLIVAICFSIGGAVVLESTLSFLGIGLPVEEVSWGKMMAEGRNMKYWWLVVFPGMAIFILVLSLNHISSHWQKLDFRV